ncbi:MAG: S9 family peptidase [Planctomycetota bacterium]|jgi:dipeptidyl aminopeptidase/acylaminoacyl peptidase
MKIRSILRATSGGWRQVTLAGGAAFAAALPAVAQEAYRQPPQAIVDILDAPPLPGVSIDPTGSHMLLIERPSMPPIRDLAQPMLRLAGMRINPRTNGTFTTSYDIGFTLRALDDDAGPEDARRVAMPGGARLGSPAWAPDGSRFAFTVTRDDGIELWVADVATARAKRLTDARLNGIGRGFRWMPDSRHVLCRLVDADRGPMPEASPVPTGPVTQENIGRVAPVRTYQDLLQSPHDEAVFEWLMTSRLHVVDTVDGGMRAIGAPGLYMTFDPAPEGGYLLVSRMTRPFSYLVPAYRFPEVVEIWDGDGNVVHDVARLPLRDEIPIEGVATGPRDFRWQPLLGSARLMWSEALDGGDPKREAEHRDKVMMLDAPFAGSPVEIARTEHRYRGMTWVERSSMALLNEYDRDRRWTRTWLVDVGNDDAEPRLVWDRSIRDRYGDPGRPVMRMNRAGRSVAMLDGGHLYLNGRGASPEGDRPFLDKLDLVSLESTRVWRCPDGAYESVVEVLPRRGTLITRHETPIEPPNYHTRALQSGEEQRQLTFFEHPAPQLRGIHKELVTYERADGVPLSATLYLPADYEPGTRLPLLVWAYPREFNDRYTAGQVSGSPYRFVRIGGSSHLFLLTQGYAIMDGATMPVIGDPETMNDTFIDQIVGAAQAAIDKAASMGVADPNRVGVGGHSYGAFMTANLLAHCDLFRAGVARSGAYNRTLTPFGFQSERRTLWEAPMAYFGISPFMHANKVNEPILLIHGEIDNNSGTFPLQSRRMFHALKGHGATARLVMLPNESHGYRSRESIGHVLAEMVDWFDTYVKHADTRMPAGAQRVGAAAGE